jgi:hypothetical protein
MDTAKLVGVKGAKHERSELALDEQRLAVYITAVCNCQVLFNSNCFTDCCALDIYTYTYTFSYDDDVYWLHVCSVVYWSYVCLVMYVLVEEQRTARLAPSPLHWKPYCLSADTPMLCLMLFHSAVTKKEHPFGCFFS